MSILMAYDVQRESIETADEVCGAGAFMPCVDGHCPHARHVVRCSRGVLHPPDNHIALAEVAPQVVAIVAVWPVLTPS